LKTKPLTALLTLFLSSCLFTGDEEISIRHLTKDFYLQDYASTFSLIQQAKDAQTHAVIIDGGVNGIGFNNDFILAEKNIDSNGVRTIEFYLIDIRTYQPATWRMANKIDTFYTEQEYNARIKELGIPDSLWPSMANLHTNH